MVVPHCQIPVYRGCPTVSLVRTTSRGYVKPCPITPAPAPQQARHTVSLPAKGSGIRATALRYTAVTMHAYLGHIHGEGKVNGERTIKCELGDRVETYGSVRTTAAPLPSNSPRTPRPLIAFRSSEKIWAEPCVCATILTFSSGAVSVLDKTPPTPPKRP